MLVRITLKAYIRILGGKTVLVTSLINIFISGKQIKQIQANEDFRGSDLECKRRKGGEEKPKSRQDLS